MRSFDFKKLIGGAFTGEPEHIAEITRAIVEQPECINKRYENGLMVMSRISSTYIPMQPTLLEALISGISAGNKPETFHQRFELICALFDTITISVTQSDENNNSIMHRLHFAIANSKDVSAKNYCAGLLVVLKRKLNTPLSWMHAYSQKNMNHGESVADNALSRDEKKSGELYIIKEGDTAVYACLRSFSDLVEVLNDIITDTSGTCIADPKYSIEFPTKIKAVFKSIKQMIDESPKITGESTEVEKLAKFTAQMALLKDVLTQITRLSYSRGDQIYSGININSDVDNPVIVNIKYVLREYISQTKEIRAALVGYTPSRAPFPIRDIGADNLSQAIKRIDTKQKANGGVVVIALNPALQSITFSPARFNDQSRADQQAQFKINQSTVSNQQSSVAQAIAAEMTRAQEREEQQEIGRKIREKYESQIPAPSQEEIQVEIAKAIKEIPKQRQQAKEEPRAVSDANQSRTTASQNSPLQDLIPNLIKSIVYINDYSIQSRSRIWQDYGKFYDQWGTIPGTEIQICANPYGVACGGYLFEIQAQSYKSYTLSIRAVNAEGMLCSIENEEVKIKALNILMSTLKPHVEQAEANSEKRQEELVARLGDSSNPRNAEPNPSQGGGGAGAAPAQSKKVSKSTHTADIFKSIANNLTPLKYAHEEKLVSKSKESTGPGSGGGGAAAPDTSVQDIIKGFEDYIKKKLTEKSLSRLGRGFFGRGESPKIGAAKAFIEFLNSKDRNLGNLAKHTSELSKEGLGKLVLNAFKTLKIPGADTLTIKSLKQFIESKNEEATVSGSPGPGGGGGGSKQ